MAEPVVAPASTEAAPTPAAGGAIGNVIGIALLLGVALLFVLAARKLFGRRHEPEAPRRKALEANERTPDARSGPVADAKETAALERAAAAAQKAIAAAAKKAEEATKRAAYVEEKAAREAERQRREAEEATLGPAEREARALERARAEAAGKQREEQEREEQRRARIEEEARKKEDYRGRKEQERLAKEQKVRDAAADAQRQRDEAAAKLRAVEEAAKADAASRRQRVAAEGGRTLLQGLERTRDTGFIARLAGLFGGKAEVSEATIGELEEILFTADIGVKTSMKLVEAARDRLKAKELADPEKLKRAIRGDIAEILRKARDSDPRPVLPGVGLPLTPGTKPWVVLVVGVNGAGKTTTIGKLAAKLKAEGRSVVLGAGDTFRAAAQEQLDVWAERAGVPIVHGPDNADPGAVLFDTVKRASAEGIDVAICDTAGRLHTKAPLMEELRRLKKVVAKASEGAPHEVLLVLDATMGQNAIQQARQFHDALQLTGIVLTKLDGTAKGGVVIGISDELSIPVRLVGVGEQIADLRPFDPDEFVAALFS